MTRAIRFAIFPLIILGHMVMAQTNKLERTPHPSSFVVIDASDRENIAGQVSLAYVWGERFSPPEKYLQGLMNLRDAMQGWTKIETTLEQPVMLGSPRIMDMPFIYIAAEKNFDLSDVEKQNLKNYLKKGGFLVIDNSNTIIQSGPGEASLKKMVLESLGGNTRFQPIPNSHPLYHCFFDFPDGPPAAAEYRETGPLGIARPTPYLEGVWIDERLTVIFSGRGYIVKWTDAGNNIPQLKMGVNMIVLSLIQDGGIAAKR